MLQTMLKSKISFTNLNLHILDKNPTITQIFNKNKLFFEEFVKVIKLPES